MSENNSLNTAHISYIENGLYKLAVSSHRYILKNKEEPFKPSLGKADEIKADKFLSKIQVIVSMMGYRLFDKLLNVEYENDDNKLYLKSNGILYAEGILTEEGFVILKGSKCREGILDGLSRSLLSFVERERSSKDIVDGVFIHDHLCSSPSMAAVIILGRNSNGYSEWKDKSNTSLNVLLNR